LLVVEAVVAVLDRLAPVALVVKSAGKPVYRLRQVSA